MSNFLKQIRRKLFGLDEQEAALHRAIADTNELIANLQQSFDHLHLNYSRTLVEVVSQSHPQTQLSCRINGLPLQIPVSVLRAYAHCLETSQKDSLNYRVESHCVDWLRQHLQTGDVFVDVGAAYGVISLPLAHHLGPTGHVYAFEPARQTRQLLAQIINHNNISNITLLPQAIADKVGSADFIEYSNDNPFTWASDTSTLAANVQPSQKHYQTYSVEITTLDQVLEQQAIRPQAIKIDIEGFELYALQGGQKTLAQCRPALCIDIHEDIRTKASALLGVQPLLESLGYRLQLQEHTLFAAP